MAIQLLSIPSRLDSRRYSVAQHILRKVAQDQFQDADCIRTETRQLSMSFALRARLESAGLL